MKIIPAAVSCPAADLNRALRAAIDASHALRAVLFDPDGFAVFELNRLNRTNPRAKPAGVAALVHRETAGSAGKAVEHRPHDRGFNTRAGAFVYVINVGFR